MGRRVARRRCRRAEDEPLQVTVQFVQAVAGVANELCQRAAEAAGVTVQPLAEKLQHFGEFGGVGGVEPKALAANPCRQDLSSPAWLHLILDGPASLILDTP